MTVTVDPKRIARAITRTTSKDASPARATPRSRPIARASARATLPAIAKPGAPARAIGGSESIRKTPARATPVAMSKVAPPAPEPEAIEASTPISGSPPPDPVLFTIRQLGRTLDDIERLRIMNGNRVGAGQREGIELPWMDTIGKQLDALEHSVELELKRAWRKHRLAAWAKEIPGAGEVLMGRLIAEIGNPADRPNPGKLLAYCGHGDPGRSGQVPKGATQAELFKRGNPAAKKATWKLAYQFMRTSCSAHTAERKRREANGDKGWFPPPPDCTCFDDGFIYRVLYDARKVQTEGKLHDKPCKRCGPSGHPAAVGSPWSDAHRHADALRIVGKRFLIDLWEADRARA